MNRLMIIAAAAATLMSATAFADEKPTADDAKMVSKTLTTWGCSGGAIEKESEAAGIYEVDDATCHGSQYDVKLDKEFKVIAITAD